jgi:apolipoprotein D and lipocalin family protein
VAARLLAQARLLGVPVDKVQWILQDGVNPTGSW